ncbi:serine/threonine-protein kinase PLK1-like isoform X1 [Penaeus chinensis]|uniref:serine/threonine-protein kinase PLK1-like isoform X1 n=2 Tax=Penaeus chinensis TaxID=139456 RepID=UPI001FB79FD2|nr:serine/threonine-protein kinase PLK1-like isoform X1 [Penaeus chinensis]
MSNQKEEPKKEIPEVIYDSTTGRKYQRGKFLGKGGFARCYELTDMKTKDIFAGKIVAKSLLVKQHQKEKMSQEISIHRSLKDRHIVGFHGFFEDSDNVYIILELCRRRSLMELHKRRKAVTEPETRYFLKQLLLGVKHLHDRKVIHRDLKLGNLFLNDEMELKIGDFGLATRVDYEGERKRTLCGTPNYIAPEILCKKGHSYEVDVWSLGCILYTLLVGKPPFETQTLKDTYMRIKKNEYHIPSRIGPLARSLIQRLLQGDPTRRPNVDSILADDFMTMGYIPTRLPTSCLTMAPRFDSRCSIVATRKPLLEINTKDGSPIKVGLKDGVKKTEVGAGRGTGSAPIGGTAQQQAVAQQAASAQHKSDEPTDCYLKDLYAQITSVVASKPDEKDNINEDESEDPAAVPMIWVSKWVDYSDKYGLGYQLCDDSIGVLFNDFTKLLLLADGENIHYIERSNAEHYHTLKSYPGALNKKVTLLRYFRNYMNEHLLKAAASMCPREGDELARIPSLRTYFRTRSAIILHLTNGTLQINFFEDHTKIILCPLMGAVTYIDEKRNFKTYRLASLEKYGCRPDLANRMRYARNMIQKLMVTKSSTTKSSTASSSAAAQHTQPTTA